MLAGPSEILVLADETANPEFIAADLLSQAEHDTLAVSTLITTDEVLAEKTITALNKQLDALPRKEFAREAFENNGTVILVDNLETGIELANDFAPEHFELIVKEPFRYLSMKKNAGAII